MRAATAALLGLAGAAGCGSSSSGIILEISSAVIPLDQVTVSVMGARGALLPEGQVGDLDPRLPLHVRIDPAGRSEEVRALGWGLRDDTRVAFGQVTFDVSPDLEKTVALRLDAMASDADADGIPDATDKCPEVADPRQEDADGDGITDACAARCPNNVLLNPDFEDDTLDPWIDENGTIEFEDQGLSGKALRACWDGEGDDWAAKDKTSVQAPGPGHYHVEAWVRPLTSTEQKLDIDLKVLDAAGINLHTYGDDEVMLGPTTWSKIVRDHDITETGAKLEVQIESCITSEGACFLLDSVCLEITP